jgi:hypothetical protein
MGSHAECLILPFNKSFIFVNISVFSLWYLAIKREKFSSKSNSSTNNQVDDLPRKILNFQIALNVS